MRLLAAFALVVSASAAFAATPDLDETEALIVRGTNRFRAEQGLGRLEPSAALSGAARAFADYMARTDRYGHSADGREPSARASAGGYEYCSVSENLSYQFSTASFGTDELARRFVEGWKGSPGHRANMLAPHIVDIGVAVARSQRTGRYYAVQMFGRPRERSIEFRVANRGAASVRYRVDEEEFTLAPGHERVHTVCAPREVTFANADGGPFVPRAGARLRVEGERRLVVRAER